MEEDTKKGIKRFNLILSGHDSEDLGNLAKQKATSKREILCQSVALLRAIYPAILQGQQLVLRNSEGKVSIIVVPK